MAQIIVDCHVTERGKTVEPGVGNGFRRFAKSDFLHALDQTLALFMDIAGLDRR